ncbi:2-C-methyl-D-erythritol 4-phosphate cytidylyltransferase [Pectinatus sottacetonis]|uniref:2-C-methyl-D-erythritol 4-phosphate cytidylyltransferase n=1 Tax=Pectinatus sottacetonis TaxID=1002795 RepID=UPI0018C61BF8|nr:2-C-methyl-D-erythritol 4-phosphate cytidylyltransferase [Pectinatus sottacetonis]
MITAIFPAAGKGKRMGASFNKVFAALSDKPILIHTLVSFSRCSLVDNFVVVAAPEEAEAVSKVLKAIPGIKPCKVVIGGTERQYSVYNGLMSVPAAADIILVHDAARPLISPAVIKNVIDEVKRSEAAVAAVPVTNTIKVINNENFVINTPDRKTLWMMQTPQGFSKDLLMKAYEQARSDNFLGTDDASLIEHIHHPVKIVMGDYKNIKITSPDDLIFAEAILGKKAVSKVKSELSSAISNAFEDMKTKLLRTRL